MQIDKSMNPMLDMTSFLLLQSQNLLQTFYGLLLKICW